MEKHKTYPASEGVCSRSEIELMISKLSPSSSTGLRNRAILTVLYRCGLRISECLSIRNSDLNFSNSHIKILHGKGDKSRIVAIDQMAKDAISTWLATNVRGETLFCNLNGKRMSSAYIRKIIKQLSEKAGIKHRVHAHGFRHTHAYELVSEGIPVHMIKDQLGHSNIATTDRYLNHLNPKERIDRIGARS